MPKASIAKLYSSEVLGRVVDAAVQIHGGYDALTGAEGDDRSFDSVKVPCV